MARAGRPRLGVQLHAALIGSPSSDARARDAKRLLDWGFSQYASATVTDATGELGRVPVDGRPGVTVPVRAAAPLRAPVRLGVPITQTLVAPAEVRGPVAAGQVLGSVTVRQGDHVLGRRDLVAARGEDGPGLWDHVRSGVGNLIP
jgi:D-alanyl-D-alanine carboxypeptidase (penicillin-binding protein 5/6)